MHRHLCFESEYQKADDQIGSSACILVPKAGLEPAHVHHITDFESVASANSTTSARHIALSY